MKLYIRPEDLKMNASSFKYLLEYNMCINPPLKIVYLCTAIYYSGQIY